MYNMDMFCYFQDGTGYVEDGREFFDDEVDDEGDSSSRVRKTALNNLIRCSRRNIFQSDVTFPCHYETAKSWHRN